MRAVGADGKGAAEVRRTGSEPGDARAARHDDAGGGCESAGQQRESLPIVEAEAEFGLRQHNHVSDEAETCIEHFGRAGALRRCVVKQHDALGDGHRARAPRKHGFSSGQLCDPEEAKAVEQRSHMPTSDGDGVAFPEELCEFRTLPCDGGARFRPESGVEFAAIETASLQMQCVDVADRFDRRARFIGKNVAWRGPLFNDVLSVERVLEAHAVEVLPVAKQRLPLTVGRMQLRVFAKDSLAARVKPKRYRATLEVIAQVLVVVLALLPSRGDGGDLSSNAELGDRFRKSWVVPLRAEENDGRKLPGDHEACTFSVRPT